MRRRTFTRKPWTDREVDHLLRHYHDGHTSAIAKDLGRPITQVYGKAYELGLKKCQAYIQAHGGRIQKGQTIGAATTFKKGQAPPNKGTKGLTGANRTSFAKGSTPHNHKPIGSTRRDKDGYQWTKVGEPNKWTMTHRLIYQEQVGPIPPGMAVVFKDGNRSNMHPDNLILQDRSQLMRTNTIQRYPEELQQLMKTLAKLNKTLNHGKKQNN